MRRRDFLAGPAAAAAAAGLARAQARSAKLGRIGMMTNDLEPILAENWDQSKEMAPKALDVMDLPDAVADRLHLHNIELMSFNLLSRAPAYVRRFKERVERAKSKVVNVTLELDGPETRYRGVVSVLATDPAVRARAVELTREWIDIAALLGAPSVMINQGRGTFPPPEEYVEGLRKLAAYGKSRKVFIIMENRGQGTPEQLTALMKASGTFANPDIGNFPNEEAREQGLRLMYPLAPTVSHVKISPRFDFAKAIRISQELGFQGCYSIETDGGPDPWAPVQKAIDALVELI